MSLLFSVYLFYRFVYNDGIMKPYKRSGNKQPTVIVDGPLERNDVLYKIMDVLTSWGLSAKQKRKGLLASML